MTFGKAKLKEKTTTIDMKTEKTLGQINLDFLFDYKIFPSNIMASKFMKHIFYLYFLILVGCTTTTSSLQEKEKSLVGNWKKPVDNGQVQGWYMEFHEDRTGVFGSAINVQGKVGIEPYMSFLMNDWRIQNDTLSIQFEMRPGYAVYGPDGEKAKKNDEPSYARYIVWEVSDTVIVIEDLIGEFPGVKDRLKKSEKLELLSE